MKSIKIFVLLALAAFCLQIGVVHSMDTKTISSSVCPEQQLIDAMKSDTPSDEILRHFFTKPAGLFNGTENINYQDSDGNTPLMVAMLQNRPEIVEKITRDYEPRLSLKNKAGKTPRGLDTQLKNKKIHDLLINYHNNIHNKIKAAYNNAHNDDSQFQELIRQIDLYDLSTVRHSNYTKKAFEDCKDQLLQKFATIWHFNLEERIIKLLFSTISDDETNVSEKSVRSIIAHYKQYINCKNTEGHTLLVRAVLNNDLKIANILLANGANPHDTITTQNPDGTTTSHTLLFEAAHNQQGAMVDALLDGGANINEQDSDGNTILMLAAMRESGLDISYINALVTNNAIDLDIKNSKGKSAIDMFLERVDEKNQNHFTILIILFIKKNLGSNRPDDLLSIAIKKMCVDLCENNKNFDSTKALFEKIVLYGLPNTTTNNYIDSIDTLIPILQNPQHIHHAFACECTSTLLSKIDDFNKISEWERSMYIYANKNVGLLKAFLDYRYKLYKEKDGFTDQVAYITIALDKCISCNFSEGIKIICQYGYDPSNKAIEGLGITRHQSGNNPLNRALMLGHVKCVQELLNHGCNPGNADTVKLAERHCKGAVPLLENAQKKTIYDLPHDVLHKILSFLPTFGFIKDRFKSINNFTQTCKNIHNVVGNTPELNTWLLSIQHLSLKEKKEILQDNLANRNYGHCCTLLEDNPNIVIPILDEEMPLMLQLITSYPLPPFEVFETIVNCIVTINKDLIKSGQTPLELNEKSYFNAVKHGLNEETAKFKTTVQFNTNAEDTEPEHRLTLMDIAICRLRHYMFYMHDSETHIETLKKIINLLRKNGKIPNKQIVVYDHEAKLYQPTSWLNLVLNIRHRQSVCLTQPWLLEFFLDELHIDINEELHITEKGSMAYLTPLSLAVNNALVDEIDIILKHPKIQVNNIGSNNRTALDYFHHDMHHPDALIKAKNIRIFITLLAAKAKTAIQIAIENKDAPLFKRCIQNKRFMDHMHGPLCILPNQKTSEIMTLCIDADFLDGIQILIDAGYNLNYKDTNKENTKESALIYALKNNKRDCALLLINGGADTSCWDANGNTPLVWAIAFHDPVKNDNSACIRALIDHRCNCAPTPNIVIADKDGNSVRVTDFATLLEMKKVSLTDKDGDPLAETTFYRLPNEILAEIITLIPGVMPSDNEGSKACMKSINNLFITNKNLNGIISNHPCKNSAELNAWLIGLDVYSEIEKKEVLISCCKGKQYRDFCALLEHNPQLAIKAQTEDCLLYVLVKQEPLPPCEVFETVITCMKTVNEKQVDAKPLDFKIDATAGAFFLRNFLSSVTERCLGCFGIDKFQRAHVNLLEIFILNAINAPHAKKTSFLNLAKKLSELGCTHDEQLQVLDRDLKQTHTVPLIFGPICDGDLVTTGILLDRLKFNPNIIGNYKGISHTPLTLAVQLASEDEAYTDIVELLSHAPGINVHQETADNKTVFDFVGNQNLPRIRALLKMPKWQPGEPSTLPATTPQTTAAAPGATITTTDTPTTLNATVPQTTIYAPGASITTTNTPGTTTAISQANSADNILAGQPAPTPVPDNGAHIVASHWIVQKPLAWLAGLSLGAVCIYAMYTYLWSEQVDEGEVEIEGDIQQNNNTAVGAL